MTHPTLTVDDHPPAGCTARVQRLRGRVLSAEPSICSERGLLVTEAYEHYAADPLVLRRAKAFAHTLDNMSITLDEGELVVGNQASTQRAAPLFPEYLVDFLATSSKSSRRPDRFQVSPEVRAVIRTALSPPGAARP
jgi:formate C-acetyltransferase